ncbi:MULTISPECIES: leucine-rich repeat domain-containing protein [Clostridium]|uniref:Leucine-rich repeat domain-containing protein n=1 Tax=Clostridium lapidicellarium TaxID=3240931 RepID=A0ABV4DTK6_9CLOT
MLRKKIEMLLCISAVCSVSFVAADTGRLNTVYAESLNSNTPVVSEQNTEDSGEEAVAINNAKLKTKLTEAANKGSGYTGDLTTSDLASITGDIDLSDLDIKDEDMPIMKYLTGVSGINLSNNTAITSKGFNKKYFDWTVPKKLDFSGCTGIYYNYFSTSRSAFLGCATLESISLPDNIGIIPTGIFENCTGLTSITIPKGVTDIKSNAFNGCTGIKEVNLDDGLLNVWDEVFKDCTSLKYIKTPSSVASFGVNCFSGDINLVVDTRGTNFKPEDESEWGDTSGVVFLYGEDAKLQDKLTLKTGGEEAIILQIPDGKTVNWGSSNNEVAAVDENGKVTAVSPGTAFIYAKTSDDTYSGFCTVTVTDEDVPVTGINLNKTNTTLEKGSTDKLTATVTPETATDKEVAWTSNKPEVATVDQDGNVAAVSKGTAIITAAAGDGKETAACTVIVTDSSASPIEISTELPEGKTSFKLGDDAKVIVKAVNNSGEEQPVSLMLGLFDKDNNNFIKCTSNKEDVEQGGQISLIGTIGIPDTGNYELRAFVWDGLEDMKPLSDVKTISVIDGGSSDDDSEVTFTDSDLEKAVRDDIKKPTGTLHKSDVDKITELDVRGKNIVDLGGIENLTSLKTLNLADNRNLNTKSISLLNELPQLESLNLSGTTINDLSLLSGLKNLQCLNLQTLSLDSGQFINTSGLKDLKNLKELDLSGNGWNINSDLSELEDLTKLQILKLGATKLKSTSVLSQLKDLRYLDLSNNPINDDLEGLEGLTNLQTLLLNKNFQWGTDDKISDISALSNLKDLTTLDLSYNQISDISSLSGLKNLQSLNLQNNKVSNITPLKDYLSALKLLDLMGNQITDISGLEGLSALTTLNLCGNEIEKIDEADELKGLTSLTDLNLNGNKLVDISGLSELESLKSLELNDNPISDITPLSGLTGLQSLSLSNTQLDNIDVLENLTNLQLLDLRQGNGKKLKNISALSNLTKLQSLFLYSNEISNITPLEKLIGLKSLDLSHNQITGVSILKDLTNLTNLDLGYNQISDITPLGGLTNLQSLDLSRNSGITDLNSLKGLTNLTSLKLYGITINESKQQDLKKSLPNCEIIF